MSANSPLPRPPVSGGSERELGSDPGPFNRITRDVIDTDAVLQELKQPEDGAAVVFEGIVRNNTRGRRTLFLEYEAYEGMALKQLDAIVSQARARFQIRDVALIHRLGMRLSVGALDTTTARWRERLSRAVDAGADMIATETPRALARR